LACPCNIVRIDILLVREFEQEGFVADEMIKDAEQEVRLACRGADRLRADAGECKEATQPLRLARNEAQGGDRKIGRSRLPGSRVGVTRATYHRILQRP
jgi:hypothetical protein